MRKLIAVISFFMLIFCPPLAAENSHFNGNIKVTVDGLPVTTDILFHDDQIFVPLRFVGDHFNSHVSWDGSHRTIEIVKRLPIPVPGKIEISGSEEFKETIDSSLNLLKIKTPDKYKMVISSIKSISEDTTGTSIARIDLYTGTCSIDINLFNEYCLEIGLKETEKKVMLSGIIVHDAYHANLNFRGIQDVNGGITRLECEVLAQSQLVQALLQMDASKTALSQNIVDCIIFSGYQGENCILEDQNPPTLTPHQKSDLLDAGTAYLDESIKVLIEGWPVDTDVMLLNSRVFVPLRFMSCNFNAEVLWDRPQNTVKIMCKVPKPDPGQIEILGSEEFKNTIKSSLSLLKDKAPEKYTMVTSNITSISEENLGVGTASIYPFTGACFVDLTLFNDYCQEIHLSDTEKQVMLAGYIVHEAYHAYLYFIGIDSVEGGLTNLESEILADTQLIQALMQMDASDAVLYRNSIDYIIYLNFIGEYDP